MIATRQSSIATLFLRSASHTVGTVSTSTSFCSGVSSSSNNITLLVHRILNHASSFGTTKLRNSGISRILIARRFASGVTGSESLKLSPLTAISAIDGRYGKQTSETSAAYIQRIWSD